MTRKRLIQTLVVPLFLVAVTGVGSGAAQEAEEVKTVEQRMDAVQAELDAATRRFEELRANQEDLMIQSAATDLEINRIERRNAALLERNEQIARDLYMNGGDGTLEAWLGSEDLGEVASRMEYVAVVGQMNQDHLEEFSETEEALREKRAELDSQVANLNKIGEDLAEQSALLQERFAQAQDEYEALQAKLEAERRREAAAARAAEVAQQKAERDAARAIAPVNSRGMSCPVDGPNSFVDTWGAPRSGGRTHEGTDVFGAMGAPLVAMVDGEITYSGVGSISGNWLILTGDDGHQYMYMHNNENLVASGRVKAGQPIATVGDSGNAKGTPPHVHFEYHPNAGEPVNPYELLKSACA